MGIDSTLLGVLVIFIMAIVTWVAWVKSGDWKRKQLGKD